MSSSPAELAVRPPAPVAVDLRHLLPLSHQEKTVPEQTKDQQWRQPACPALYTQTTGLGCRSKSARDATRL